MDIRPESDRRDPRYSPGISAHVRTAGLLTVAIMMLAALTGFTIAKLAGTPCGLGAAGIVDISELAGHTPAVLPGSVHRESPALTRPIAAPRNRTIWNGGFVSNESRSQCRQAPEAVDRVVFLRSPEQRDPNAHGQAGLTRMREAPKPPRILCASVDASPHFYATSNDQLSSVVLLI